MPHLLLLVRNAETRLELQQHLNAKGITWIFAESADEALRRLKSDEAPPEFDATFIDLSPVFQEGVRLLEGLRACPRYRRLPILVLADSHQELDAMLHLDAGADDYLSRPLSAREMVARIMAVFRRASLLPMESPAHVLVYASLAVDLETQVARADGKPLELTPREFELLAFFLQHPHHVLDRERLLREVWGFTYLGESRTIDAHVRRLRSKLGNASSLIETIVGVGYRLGTAAS
jgi:DNA-binding response OmpR family regulator